MHPDLQLAVRHYRIYPAKAPLGHEEVEIGVQAGRMAVLAIDLYGTGYGADEEISALPGSMGALHYPTKRQVVLERIAPALQAARSAGVPVVYVTSSAPRVEVGRSAYGAIQRRLGANIEEDLREPENDPAEYAVGPASVLRFSSLLAPRSEDYYVRKLTYSGFFSTRLDRLLRNLGTETVVLMGFTAETGMFCTALDAFHIGYRVVWMRDGTLAIGQGPADSEWRTHRLALWAETDIGFTTRSADFVRALAGAREA